MLLEANPKNMGMLLKFGVTVNWLNTQENTHQMQVMAALKKQQKLPFKKFCASKLYSA